MFVWCLERMYNWVCWSGWKVFNLVRYICIVIVKGKLMKNIVLLEWFNEYLNYDNLVIFDVGMVCFGLFGEYVFKVMLFNV